jgi:hypothetical protein
MVADRKVNHGLPRSNEAQKKQVQIPQESRVLATRLAARSRTPAQQVVKVPIGWRTCTIRVHKQKPFVTSHVRLLGQQPQLFC